MGSGNSPSLEATTSRREVPPVSVQERGHGKQTTEREPAETSPELAETPQKTAKTGLPPAQRAWASPRAETPAHEGKAIPPRTETTPAPTEAEQKLTEKALAATEQKMGKLLPSSARSTSAGLGTETPAWAGKPGHGQKALRQEGKARLETPGHSPQPQTPIPRPDQS